MVLWLHFHLPPLKISSCFYFCTSLRMPALSCIHLSNISDPTSCRKPDIDKIISPPQSSFLNSINMWQTVVQVRRVKSYNFFDFLLHVHLHWRTQIFAYAHSLTNSCVLVSFGLYKVSCRTEYRISAQYILINC